MTRRRPAEMLAPGPFKVDALPSKSAYELDQGHAVLCLPTQARGGRAQIRGGLVVATDPLVQDAGVEVGFDLGGETMRAPDVSILRPGAGDGWVKGAPALAIEYADDGQDEPELRAKIAQLLQAGAEAIWVVRLGRLQHVEVHQRGMEPRIFHSHETLTLPGVLQNPVPVAALFDADQAEQLALRNLLDRFGFQHPDQAREQGREEGREEGRLDGLRRAAVAFLRGRGHPDPEGHAATLGEAAVLTLFSGR